MKIVMVVAMLGLSACATSPTQQAEIGYTKGSLGYAAMMKRDWVKAEAQLAASTVDANDPALLLNLAQLYRVTDRDLAARDLYARVLEQDDLTLALGDGRVASAHEIAKAGLAGERLAARE
jgi:hypothetical protein